VAPIAPHSSTPAHISSQNSSNPEKDVRVFRVRLRTIESVIF
jgi:hypothetical protein